MLTVFLDWLCFCLRFGSEIESTAMKLNAWAGHMHAYHQHVRQLLI